jgi:hypothetical protein
VVCWEREREKEGKEGHGGRTWDKKRCEEETKKRERGRIERHARK